MAAELIALGRGVDDQLSLIAERGPHVAQNHHKRLVERVSALVQEHGVTVEPKDLIREVAILADRSDISEEIVRLRAHLTQYFATIDEPESSGRKLEFISQEMGREINTIGSKAGDVEISQAVVEVKAASGKNSRAGPKCRVNGDGWAKLPGRLIVISGPSGSGKSTLVRRLLARPDLRLRVSVSATTRQPRPGEEPGSRLCFS